MQPQLTLFATEKRCPRCGKTKPTADFNRRSRTPDGLNEYCRTCSRERNRDYERRNRARATERYKRWVAANPERAREITLKFRAANPGRGTEYSRRYRYAHPEVKGRVRDRKRRGIDEETAQWVETITADPCAYCGAAGGTVDHIVSLHHDGDNHWTNYSGACLACNGAKRERSLLEHLMKRNEAQWNGRRRGGLRPAAAHRRSTRRSPCSLLSPRRSSRT